MFKIAASSIFGQVQPPPGYTNFENGSPRGIPILVSIIINTLIIIAGVYAVFNLLMAGYWYMTAAGDSKRISDASAKIWQTILGLLVASGSLMFAGVLGQILYKDPGALLNIQLFTP